MQPNPVPFRPRAFTSLVVALGFAALLASGVVLFLAPPGRVANWTQWEILGLTKHGWGDLHIAFGAVFVVAGLVHLAFNWRPMLQHLGARMAGRGGLRFEWVAALLVSVGVFAGTRAHVPPFSTLLAWSEQLRGGWEADRETAPIPHAELLTLAELAAQAGVTPEEALRRLERAGVKDAGVETQVQALAERANLTPAQVFGLLRAESATDVAPASTSHGPRGPGARGGGGGGGGGGPGWKSLSQFCADEGIGLDDALARLARRDIKASANQTLREIAVANGFDRPYELLEILRRK